MALSEDKYKIKWGQTGDKRYEQGVSQGALYVMRDSFEAEADLTKGKNVYKPGVAWNGLVSVSESPQGGDAESIWADNGKYLTLIGSQSLEGSMECYTFPEAFNACVGDGESPTSGVTGVHYGQQSRKKFAFVYRTEIGDDTSATKGYKIHIVYGCYANASEKTYNTINDSPEAETFSFDYSSDPVEDSNITVNGKALKTASVTLDSTVIDATKMAQIELALFGQDEDSSVSGSGVTPYILYPNEIETILTQSND